MFQTTRTRTRRRDETRFFFRPLGIGILGLFPGSPFPLADLNRSGRRIGITTLVQIGQTGAILAGGWRVRLRSFGDKTALFPPKSLQSDYAGVALVLLGDVRSGGLHGCPDGAMKLAFPCTVFSGEIKSIQSTNSSDGFAGARHCVRRSGGVMLRFLALCFGSQTIGVGAGPLGEQGWRHDRCRTGSAACRLPGLARGSGARRGSGLASSSGRGQSPASQSHCGGAMKIVSLIECRQRDVIERIRKSQAVTLADWPRWPGQQWLD
jgi:hypothetical protein